MALVITQALAGKLSDIALARIIANDTEYSENARAIAQKQLAYRTEHRKERKAKLRNEHNGKPRVSSNL